MSKISVLGWLAARLCIEDQSGGSKIMFSGFAAGNQREGWPGCKGLQGKF